MTTIPELIRSMAADAGYSPNVGNALVGISHHESSHDPRALGDGGTSYGLFQLHRNGGALGNISDAQARKYWDPRENTAFALRAIKPFVNSGMSVEQAVDAISRKFERPANPSGEIAAALAYLRSGGSSSTPIQSTPSVTDATAAPAGPSPGLVAAVKGGYRNEDLLNLPHIKLPDIGGQIPFRAALDPGVAPHEAPQPSQIGEAIVAAAKNFLGVPYVWGGASPKGFDCSGLVQYVFGKFGVKTPRVSEQQFLAGKKVDPARAQSGDLIFFRHPDGAVGHVGIYLGGGQFLHAPHKGDVVKISKLAGYGLPVAGFRRYAR